MNESIIQYLVQNGGAVATVVIFIFYLIRKDGTNSKTFQDFNNSLHEFNNTLRNHLNSQVKAQTASSKAQVEMSKAFQQLSDCIRSLNGQSKHKE